MEAQAADPRVTILMVIVKNFKLVDRCIRSIFRYTKEPFVLLLGDNGTGPDSRPYFEKWRSLPNTHVIRTKKLLKHGEFIDILVKQVNTPYFLLMDSDTEILRDSWLNEMLSGFEADQKIMEVGSDFNEGVENYVEPVGQRTVRLNKRFGPWFLMFRTEVLEVCWDVSFAFYKEVIRVDGKYKYSVWDTSGRVHFNICQQGYGYKILPRKFKRNFIHYGKMSHLNTPQGVRFLIDSYVRRLFQRWFGSPLWARGFYYSAMGFLKWKNDYCLRTRK